MKIIEKITTVYWYSIFCFYVFFSYIGDCIKERFKMPKIVDLKDDVNKQKTEEMITFAFKSICSKKNKKLLIGYAKNVRIDNEAKKFIDQFIHPWAKKIIYSHTIKNA